MMGIKKGRLGALTIDIVAFIAIFIVSQIVVGFIVSHLFEGASWSGGTVTDFGFFATYLCAMVPILILATRYESTRYQCSMPIKAAWRGFDPVMVLWGLILMISVTVVISPITSMLPHSDRTMPLGGWTLVTACVIAPVFEELIFRGRLFSILNRTTSSLVSAMLTALIFGAVHGSVSVMIDGFVSGMIFSYVYIVKGSIIAPILLHMCNNAIAYAMMVLSYQNKGVAEILGESVNMLIVYVVAIVITIVGSVVVVRTLRRHNRPIVVEAEENVVEK